MKKLITGLMAVVGGISLLPSHASAYQTIARSVNIASVTVSGTASGSLVTSIVNRSGGAASKITWSGTVYGQSLWKIADQYVKLDSSYTGANFAVRLYTDNKDLVVPNTGAGQLAYNGSTTTAAGLLSRVRASTFTSTAIPLGWKIVASTMSVPTTSSITVQNPFNATTGVGAFDWLWLKDAYHGDFSNTPGTTLFDYETAWNDLGIHYGGGAGDFGPGGSLVGVWETNYLYFSVPQLLRTGGTYQTNKLIIELLSL